MSSDQAILSWEALQALPVDGTVIWTTASLATRVGAVLHFPQTLDEKVPPVGIQRVIVLGGGSLIDCAKLWRKERSPATWLIAVPSLWGSGAEASIVAVRQENGRKVPYMEAELLPDARAVWPELADSIPVDLARWGMGDAWSHALEAFLSPLASETLRGELAIFLRDRLLPQPLVRAPHWFDLSAEACRFQSLAGVGLVHGMAHEIEPNLFGFGHARLCATLLWPVMSFNARRGNKIRDLAADHALPLDFVFARIKDLYADDDFTALLPVLTANWMSVLRNPLSRINGVVCRPADLAWFVQREFANE